MIGAGRGGKADLAAFPPFPGCVRVRHENEAARAVDARREVRERAYPGRSR